jgi:hypothetical protein
MRRASRTASTRTLVALWSAPFSANFIIIIAAFEFPTGTQAGGKMLGVCSLAMF